MKGYKSLMSKSMERAVGKGIQLGTVFAEVSSAHMETSRTLTPLVRSDRKGSPRCCQSHIRGSCFLLADQKES